MDLKSNNGNILDSKYLTSDNCPDMKCSLRLSVANILSLYQVIVAANNVINSTNTTKFIIIGEN